MPADLDRQFGRYNLPDHGNLLANLIRWAAKDNIPLAVECAGLIDCNLYHQPGSSDFAYCQSDQCRNMAPAGRRIYSGWSGEGPDQIA